MTRLLLSKFLYTIKFGYHVEKVAIIEFLNKSRLVANRSYDSYDCKGFYFIFILYGTC